jgi:hypothetical protein
MQRDIPQETLRDLEGAHPTETLIAFLTVRHDNLAEPIRIVSDLFDYVRGGDLFTGIPFDVALVNDDDQQPVTEVRVQNIDRRIGAALRDASGVATVELDICTSSDFDMGQDPRQEIGTADVIYRLTHYELRDVSADALEVSGRAALPDYASEPWPAITTTQLRCPGLYFR